jgi:Ca2+-binding RTX toxin-like protein
VFDKIYNREIPATATTANDIINARGAFVGQDTGDVFALLKTGYNFDGTQATPVVRQGDPANPSTVFSVPNFYGAHGYDPTLPEMKAILYAAGPDISPQQLGSVNNIDIAPTIEKILDVAPASTVDGKALSLSSPSAASAVTSGDPTQNLKSGSADDLHLAPTNQQNLFADGVNHLIDGKDKLFAGTIDSAIGGDGDDILLAGKGGNTLQGGRGADKFYLADADDLPDGFNTISDFEMGIDKLRLFGIAGATDFSKITLIQQGADTLVKAGGKDLALLTGVQTNGLNSNSFSIG